jgi:hypothetical protein
MKRASGSSRLSLLCRGYNLHCQVNAKLIGRRPGSADWPTFTPGWWATPLSALRVNSGSCLSVGSRPGRFSGAFLLEQRQRIRGVERIFPNGIL